MPGDSRRNCGAANPRVLAELRAGRKIDWSKENSDKLLSQLLDVPAERLYDPKYASPIYAGVPLDFGPRRCPSQVSPMTDIRTVFDQTRNVQKLIDAHVVSDSILQKPATNLMTFSAEIGDQVKRDLNSMEFRCARQATPAVFQRSSELAVASRLSELSQAQLVNVGTELGRLNREILILPPAWWQSILSDLNFSIPGEYFVDAPTATSPVQGGLGDCWLISALSAVAWTNPELINEKLRRENLAGDVDGGHAGFRFDFSDVVTINIWFLTITIPWIFNVWTNADVPQTSWGGYLYASSSVPKETWPAVIEKAFAVWRSGGNADFPNSSDYGHLNGGDCAWACHVLTGAPAWYHWADADDTWSTIVSNCTNGRANTPLVAWTWGSGDDSPDKVDYAGANLVANHCYTILGTLETNKRQYVILRNPWGYHEGTLNVYAGPWSSQEYWGTATLSLPTDGVFALEVHVFREYFMGFGGAK
jgi:Calpain family cysteine protease